MIWVSGSNSSGALYSYSTTLTSGSYTYRIYGYDGTNYNNTTAVELNVTMYPDEPYNGSATFATGGVLNITWNRGNYSDEDVVIRKASGYATSPLDGEIVDRTSNNTGTPPNLLYYYNTTATSSYYYVVYSYNNTNLTYSLKSLKIPMASTVGLNCFNESNPSQAIPFDILISNVNTSQTYQADALTNTHWLPLESIPYGEDMIFHVTSPGYKSRTYYYDLELGEVYNLTFYLPPKETSGDEGGGGGGDTVGTLRSFTNVQTVTNPALDATISLSHDLESIIEVSRYDVIYNQQSKTDSISVSNPSVNVSIPLTKTLDELIGVYVFNSSIYGGWVTVPDDKYSLNTTHCEIDDSVMDDNTKIARIDYYYMVEGYGQWITIADDKYTASTSQVTVDSSVLNDNTSMVKAEYYYITESTQTKLYIVKVVNEYDVGISDAKVDVKRYMNSTSGFESVTVLKTDANGQSEVYLIPNVLYKVFIEADQYKDLEISEWIPDPEFYGIYYPKTFRLMFKEGTYPDDEVLMDNITWSIEPQKFYWNTSFWVYFNISSADNKIEWFNASLYQWNSTTFQWLMINWSNQSTPNGGSIGFEVPNVTGRYSFSCTFKKENFSAYTFGTSDGCRTYHVYWEILTQQISTIPDMAYLIISIIFALLLMVFLVKFGAGAKAGIAGLVLLGGMWALKPDMMVGVAGHEISVWLLWLATAIVYFLVMFINRGK
jgi:hypothetical protein